MLKQRASLEIEKGDRTYNLVLNADSPLGEVHDVLTEMKAWVLNLINEQIKKEAEAAKVIPATAAPAEQPQV